MRILVTGASGLVGSALVCFLRSHDHTVSRLVRSVSTEHAEEIQWDPAAGQIDVNALEGFDAVVHLAGENISSGRWTATRKAKIRDSRIKGTTLLSQTLARLERPPSVLVAASAIGYYGNRGDEVLHEASVPGSGFLAEVCQTWEEATQAARDKQIRTVRLRLGVVLAAAGGALAKMLPPFRFGLGGVIGGGSQYMSWIALDDAVGAIEHCLAGDQLSGPVNAVAPSPVTNREFTRTLGKVLARPTLFPVPAIIARLSFGEMADELLLASTRVEPRSLLSAGYAFRFPELEGALRHLLGR